MNLFIKTTASVLLGLTALGGTAAIVPTLASAQPVEAPVQADDTQADDTQAESPRAERRNAKAQALADLLGITVEELQTEREAGQSVADIAEANGVSVQSIIDAIVADKTERVEAKVADGTIDADRAADKLADLEAKITEKVNNTDTRGERGHRGHRGHRGPGANGGGTTT